MQSIQNFLESYRPRRRFDPEEQRERERILAQDSELTLPAKLMSQGYKFVMTNDTNSRGNSNEFHAQAQDAQRQNLPAAAWKHILNMIAIKLAELLKSGTTKNHFLLFSNKYQQGVIVRVDVKSGIHIVNFITVLPRGKHQAAKDNTLKAFLKESYDLELSEDLELIEID